MPPFVVEFQQLPGLGGTMHIIIAVLSITSVSMCAIMLAAGALGLAAARNEIARARGIDKVVGLTYVCFGVPLAAFGALHLSDPNSLLALVPKYMPWRMFWVYFVGFALIAAGLSIVTRIQVRWSGLMVGIMMLLFVAMLYLPGAIRSGARLTWTIVFRESSFGGAGWVLAGAAMGAIHGRGKFLVAVGRALIGMAAIFFGVQHFLHPLGMPGVPLQKLMPTWVPAREAIDYATGAFLVAGGVCFLALFRARMAAAYLGAWILATIAAIYVPVMIGALVHPDPAVQVEGIDYFADTLLFAGATLSVACASSDGSKRLLRGRAVEGL